MSWADLASTLLAIDATQVTPAATKLDSLTAAGTRAEAATASGIQAEVQTIMPSYSERQIETLRVAGENVVAVANRALQIANKSHNVPTREVGVLMAKHSLRNLKHMSAEYAFLKLPTLEAFEKSIREVERETQTIIEKAASTIPDGGNVG
jgi:hypothetical protein